MSTPTADTTLQTPSPDLSAPAINPYLGLVIATIAVSFSAILIKVSTAPSLVIATYRLAMTTLLLLPLMRGSRLAALRALDRRTLGLIVLSGTLLAIHFASWTASLRYTSVASSVLFVTIHPAIVAIAAFTLFAERSSRLAILGIVLTLLGSGVVAGGDIRLGGDAVRGDLLALLGAVVFAGYLLIGRGTRQNMDNIGYSVPVYGVCAVALTLFSVGFGQSLAAVSGRDLLIFFGLALIPTLGGHLLYNWALRYVPAAVVSVSFLGEPVGAAILAWLLLGQHIALSTLLGGAIILVGIWLTARW
ncbi:MAG: putative rane protein [Chloroflexi bacterium]|nr:putative rane protein [Chloroflexota bacterium]